MIAYDREMHRTIGVATQWIGRIVVVVAVVLLIWNFADLADEPDFVLGWGGPSRTGAYLSVLASSASLAVGGMLAMALGSLLERVATDEP